jgi:SNF2 family DNA or RNA helicase
VAESWIPKKYQEKAIKFMTERACAGLFLDPGLGKTSVSLAVYKILKAAGLVKAMLVVAPLRICHLVWPPEIQKWEEFRRLKFEVLHGDDKAEALRRKADVYIVNYDGLEWLSEELGRMADWPFDMLVVDESSRVKNTNTKRFKLLKPMLNRFRRRYILTGTPASRSLEDLFGQVFVMDRGATFGPYITHFRNEYFYPGGYGGYEWLPQAGAEKKIFAKLAPRVLRMAAEDYLDLPKLVINDVKVRLPEKARKVYNEMELRLRADLDSGRISAANAGVASLKCRQIANGGLYTNVRCTEWENLHDAKTEAVVDLLEELSGQPTMVLYDFDHDLERLREALGNPPHLGGGVPTKRAKEIEAAWNRGELPVLLGQPQTVAYGLNLQAGGRALIWHSLTWNYEDYDQAIRRIWRQGQKFKVVSHRVIAEGTVDEAMVLSMSSKANRQQRVFDALKKYWERRKI